MSPRTLTDSHKRAMQEGRRRAIAERPQRRKQRLQEVDARLTELGALSDALRAQGDPTPLMIRDEMRELAHEWTAIRAEILREAE